MVESVLVEVEDGVMVITINRPEAKNALNGHAAKAIAKAIDHLENDNSIRVAILTGAGGTFCAGMDLKAFLAGDLPVVEGRGFGGLTEKLPGKPLIAAVEGHALAGGCELMLACDLVVAADDARFGIPEVKRGLVAAAGGLVRLPRQIPERVAMEMALTGSFFSAQRALDIGLINRTVPPGEALSAARVLASEIFANSPIAVAASKKVIREQYNWSETEMFEKQNVITSSVFSSEDAKEGAAAFAEKRPPSWKGR